MSKIFKVVQQGQAFAVQSKSAPNGQTMKCGIILRELGGEYENTYMCTLWGNDASVVYQSGDLVVAALRFSTHEYQGPQGTQVFQDISVKEIRKI